MKKLLIVLAVLGLLIGGIYLTFKGKMPFVSEKVWAQVDLGVEKESTDKIYDFYDEIGYVNNLKGDTPKTGDIVFEKGIEIEHTFTQAEINSWITAWEGEWAGLPFSNSQIKINKDGSVEASSSITIETAEEFARELGYTDAEIAKAEAYLKYVPAQLPLYAKGTAEILNNSASINIQSFKVAGYTLPNAIASGFASILEGIAERTIRMSDQTDIQKAVVTATGVDFAGVVPGSISIK